MNYTIVNRQTNFKANHVQRVNEEKVGIANISKDIHKNLLEVFSLLHERLKTYSDKLDFTRIVENVLGIVRARKAELVRVKRLEDMKVNAGFTLISIIIVLGIVGFSFITFFIIKGILY